MLLPAAAQAQTLKLWSHWAGSQDRRAFVEGAARAFEAANPGVKIEFSWYDKPALYSALRTALRAGQAPDIFYAEPDQQEYIDNNFLADLSKGVNWEGVEPWAKKLWSRGEAVYGFPLEAWSVELFYRPDIAQRVGVEIAPGQQMSGEAFLDVIRKARAAGVTPISLGVGDRPFPGAFLTSETLVKMLGIEDYGRLLKGELSWTDPRVMKGLKFVKDIADSGGLPTTFSTMRLTESTSGFHRAPGTMMLLMGTFYIAGSLAPVDRGGAGDIKYHVMQWPALEGAACPNCKTIAVGGSYVVNAASTHKDKAMAFLNSMAKPEVGARWLEVNAMQTGIKATPTGIPGRKGEILSELYALNEKTTYFFGTPIQVMKPKPREVFTQVINQALPAGLLSAEEAAARMSKAY